MEREGELSSTNGALVSDILKPLLRGCLTGGLHNLVLCGHSLIKTNTAQLFSGGVNMANLKMMYMRELRFNFLYGTAFPTVSLGLFEILTKKIRTKFNDGEPLSLYQEALCGLTSGATATLVSQPIMTMLSHATEHGHRNMATTLSHIVRTKGLLALWSGSGSYVCIQMAAYMAMLPSYNRSLRYFTESKGLPKWQAQMSASIVSGFLAATCSFPVLCVGTALEGDKNAYRNIPRLVLQLLSSRKLVCGVFLNYLGQRTVFCMVQWFMYERIRAAEELMDQGKPTRPTVGYLGKG